MSLRLREPPVPFSPPGTVSQLGLSQRTSQCGFPRKSMPFPMESSQAILLGLQGSLSPAGPSHPQPDALLCHRPNLVPSPSPTTHTHFPSSEGTGHFLLHVGLPCLTPDLPLPQASSSSLLPPLRQALWVPRRLACEVGHAE